MQEISQDMIDTSGWGFQVECPECGVRLHAQRFFSTGKCTACKHKFNFYLEEEEQ